MLKVLRQQGPSTLTEVRVAGNQSMPEEDDWGELHISLLDVFRLGGWLAQQGYVTESEVTIRHLTKSGLEVPVYRITEAGEELLANFATEAAGIRSLLQRADKYLTG
jgi:hypothetical protein